MVKSDMGEKTESFRYVAASQPAPESFKDKFFRRAGENPLVPIGV